MSGTNLANWIMCKVCQLLFFLSFELVTNFIRYNICINLLKALIFSIVNSALCSPKMLFLVSVILENELLTITYQDTYHIISYLKKLCSKEQIGYSLTNFKFP